VHLSGAAGPSSVSHSSAGPTAIGLTLRPAIRTSLRLVGEAALEVALLVFCRVDKLRGTVGTRDILVLVGHLGVSLLGRIRRSFLGSPDRAPSRLEKDAPEEDRGRTRARLRHVSRQASKRQGGFSADYTKRIHWRDSSDRAVTAQPRESPKRLARGPDRQAGSTLRTIFSRNNRSRGRSPPS
jgi:hypothetical protein